MAEFLETITSVLETTKEVVDTILEVGTPILESVGEVVSSLGKRDRDEETTREDDESPIVPTLWINCTNNAVPFFESKKVGEDWIAAGKPAEFPGVEIFPVSGVVLNATGRDRNFVAIINNKRYASCKPKKFSMIEGLDELDEFIMEADHGESTAHDSCKNVILIVSTITADNFAQLVNDTDCILAVPDSGYVNGVFEKQPNGDKRICGTTKWIFYTPGTETISIPYYKGSNPDIYIPEN